MLRILCLLVLCATLTAGLWPFHAPGNDVEWSPKGNGLVFGNYGTVLSSGEVDLTHPEGYTSCSLELWIKPRRSRSASVILAFYNPLNPLQLMVRQSNPDLAIQLQPGSERVRKRVYVNGILRANQPVFLTITSNEHGTAVYLNGIMARSFPRFLLPANTPAGRLVLGTAPTNQASWSGELLGLAMYKTSLSPERVREHFTTWNQSTRPRVTAEDQPTALYLFNEHSGRVIHDAIPSGVNLSIPERFMILHQDFLRAPWNEYYPALPYWKNVLINIAGFVPLGFCFCAYWAQFLPIRRAIICAILVGIAVTFTIEILQGYLPTRQSGVTDLFTNTLGTWIGAGLYEWNTGRAIFERMLKRFRALSSR
jgi:hypothetical protein